MLVFFFMRIDSEIFIIIIICGKWNAFASIEIRIIHSGVTSPQEEQLQLQLSATMSRLGVVIFNLTASSITAHFSLEQHRCLPDSEVAPFPARVMTSRRLSSDGEKANETFGRGPNVREESPKRTMAMLWIHALAAKSVRLALSA